MATETVESSTTAPGPLPENLYGDLPDWNFVLWPSSTTVIMAALFLALGFTVNMQITERIDTALWGGVSPLLGVFFFSLWNATGAMFYGIPGALIVANINPMVANLTATNPLAPTFFATNSLYAVPMALWMYYLKQPGEGISFGQFAIAHCLTVPLTLIPLSFIHIFVLNFTLPVTIGWFVAGLVFGYAGMFIAYPFVKKLLEAGVVQR
jgi:hypothetical protein